MLMFTKLKVFILIGIFFMLTACSPKQYSFEIDAPPKYSSEYVFKSMSVKNFKSDKKQYLSNIERILKSGIAKEGYIKIVEQGEEAVLSGVLYIGTVHQENSSSSYDCEKKIDGKKVKSTCYGYTYQKKHLLKIDYSLTRIQDNSVIFGESISEEFEDSWYSSQSASKARMSAISDEEIINNSLQKIATKIIQAVSPHKEKVSRELQEGDSDSVKLGITYIENGRVEQALAIWDQCIGQAESTKSVAASYYNIGVIKESQSNYRDAFNLYSKANRLLPTEELYIKAMTRVETLNKQNSKVREWKSQ
ncbi:MAG: Unknown protein [uncultured Sulfurovum sp.]|uniref:Uncharacterized protein n=1 Tax=uncultured Sulfurovum sp. TaxID=269237 RepID=A0A6S6TIP9_9BACT|nr:MAG: Unknown protein [uncultured Sulfurovum sp.]